MGARTPLRVLATREYQNSITESVHKLLADQVDDLGLGGFYNIQKTTITGLNGTAFTFAGLHHNINSIKSMEGIDIAWVEEAQTVSKSSWDVLIPTVRQPGSEIWLTWNPDLDEDETYQRFVVFPPPGTMDIQANWSDNPWFPETLRDEKDYLKSVDYESYLNVWEGQCRNQVENPLWTKETLSGCRLPRWETEDARAELIKSFQRIVVAVDPSGCSGDDDERSDEIGIVVAGLGHDGVAKVVADLSGRYSPDGWSRVVCNAYADWRADRVIAEKNFGGSLVERNIRVTNLTIPLTLVDASRGKSVRAEPVSALYEQGRVKHVGHMPELEAQMLKFSTSGYRGARSPDRADAAVWAITELMVGRRLTPITTNLPKKRLDLPPMSGNGWMC